VAELNLSLFYSMVYEWFQAFTQSFLRALRDRRKTSVFTWLFKRFRRYRLGKKRAPDDQMRMGMTT
jgi:hypothetical protein